MPNDAKFGLVVGVALVIAVAVVFFRKDGSGRVAVIGDAPARAADGRDSRLESQSNRSANDPTPLNQVSRQKPLTGRQHIVQAGDTLFSIASQYYGDGDRFDEIYRANRDVLRTPDAPPTGVTLRIP